MSLFNTKKMLLLAAAVLPLTTLQASPGFSRQMDMSCMACHNQTMGQLNSFGRKFAASGYTMTSGSQSMIDGDTLKLGLPSALNAGVLLKARYLKSNPDEDGAHEEVGTDRGSLEMYKVSKLFFGGKIAENVGGMGNYSYDSFGAKVTYVDELGSGYAGITGFMDDDFGPFSGGEYYNTGLYAPLKLFESRRSTNAAQATEIGHGPATGIQAYYGGETLYVSAGAYLPAISQHEGLDSGTSGIGVGRIAVAPTFGEWTVMVGAYGLSGTATMSEAALDNVKPKADSTKLIDIKREAFGLDAQIEGNIAGASTVLVLNAVLKNRTTLYDNGIGDYVERMDPVTGYFVNSEVELKAGDNTAFSAELQVNPWEAFGIKLAYLYYNDEYSYADSKFIDKQDRNDYSLGLDYSLRQNVRFGFEYTYSNVIVNDRRSNGGTLQSLPDSKNILAFAIIGF